MARNARFWMSYLGGWVKLTMAVGDEIHLKEGGATDEGYSVTWTSYTFDGKTVERSLHNDSRDCDGRSSRDLTLECRVRKLASRACYVDREFIPTASKPYNEDYCPAMGAKLPDWQEVESSQHDYSAERAGY